MRWLVFGVTLALSGCRCGDASLSGRFGDLVVVQTSSTGREVLLKEATVSVAPVFMGSSGEGTVAVRNVGVEEVTIDAVELLEGDPALTLEGLGREIGAGRDDALPFRFVAPQASDVTVPETQHRARYALTLGGTRAGDEKLIIELVAVAVARDCYVPAQIDFGGVPLRHAVTLDFTLQNGSPLDTTTTLGSVTGADLSAFSTAPGAGDVSVPAMSATTVRVRFEPLEARAYAASVTMRRAPACPEGTTRLVGTGNDAALAWTPERLDFGRIPLQLTVTKKVTFSNGSNAPLSMLVRAPGGDFAVANTPTTLAAQGVATFDVSCTPTALGPRSGVLEVELGTDPLTVARLPLTCIGGGPRVRVDPNPLLFGSVPLNETTRRRIIVQNVGTAPAMPGDASMNLVLGGPGGSTPWFAIVPKNANTSLQEFGVGLRSTYDPAVGVPAIAGKNIIEFELTITPFGNATLREADLLVYSNDALEPIARIPLSAQPRLRESCLISFEPPVFDFGRVPAGSSLSRTVIVRNAASEGSVCLLSGVELAPGSDLSFTMTEPLNGSVLINGGSQRPIVVNLAVPSTTPAGTFLRGAVRFHAAGEQNDRSLPVSALVSQCLIAAPPVVNVGLVQTGCTSASRPVTLYNLCGVPITVSIPTPPAAPFNLTAGFSGSVAIDPGQPLSVSVNAAPTTEGPLSGVLHVESVSGEQLDVPLLGTADTMGLQSENFEQVANETDILLVIDNSCSMGDEQAALGQNFAAFISAAATSGINWNIGVITTDTAEDGVLRRRPGEPAVLKPNTPNVGAVFANKVNVGLSGSGWERPFASMEAAVSTNNLTGANSNFLRPNAPLAVVIVSDASDQSPNSTSSYIAALQRAKGNKRELINVSVVGPFSPPSMSCPTEGQDISGRYHTIVTATGGVEADICTSNWSMDLESVSRTVFASRRQFELTGAARGQSDITVTVNGQVVTNWSFNPGTNSVVFTAPVPPAGADIDITYRTACF